MIKNSDIIECSELVHLDKLQFPDKVPYGYHCICDSGGDGIPFFKLFKNNNKYVLLIQGTKSFFAKDVINFLDSSMATVNFENGRVDNYSYKMACEIIKIIQYKLTDPKIKDIFCTGFSDGGAISAVIAAILHYKNHSIIENSKIFQKFNDRNVYSIIFGAPPTFSANINIVTRTFIKNFILIDDNFAKQNGLSSKIPIFSMISNLEKGFNSNNLPGFVIPLNPSIIRCNSIFHKVHDLLKYVGFCENSFNPYYEAILHYIGYNDELFKDEEFKANMFESCAKDFQKKSKETCSANDTNSIGNREDQCDLNSNKSSSEPRYKCNKKTIQKNEIFEIDIKMNEPIIETILDRPLRSNDSIIKSNGERAQEHSIDDNKSLKNRSSEIKHKKTQNNENKEESNETKNKEKRIQNDNKVENKEESNETENKEKRSQNDNKVENNEERHETKNKEKRSQNENKLENKKSKTNEVYNTNEKCNI